MIKKLCWCGCIIIALLFICINTCFEKTESALASSVIRLHVIANSDTAEDQELKLQVRDSILKNCEKLFNSGSDINTAKKRISSSLDEILQIAEKTISENGYSYTVKASLGKSTFPTKEYGNLILPAGSYEALKIEIGEAKGRNWWCVLFPPLCFVDESCVSVSNDAVRSIEKNLGEKNASLISTNKTGSAEIRFKSYEIWQKSKQKLAMLLN